MDTEAFSKTVEGGRVSPSLYRDEVDFDESTGYYTPPVEPETLAGYLAKSGFHGSIVQARARILASDYVENDILDFQSLWSLAMDLVTFGQCCFQIVRNLLGQPIRLQHAPMQPMRIGRSGRWCRVTKHNDTVWYNDKEIYHVKLYDPNQNVYGLPDYLSGLEAALLGGEALTFRRRYYANGAHLGYILYTTEPNLSPAAEEKINKSFEASKGVGNFKSIYVNIPNGHEKGVQVIPIGESKAKDEFEAIKKVTSQEVMVAHRFPAGLSGIMPLEGSAGLGDPQKYAETYYKTEVRPMQKLLESVNRIMPKNKQIRIQRVDG